MAAESNPKRLNHDLLDTGFAASVSRQSGSAGVPISLVGSSRIGLRGRYLEARASLKNPTAMGFGRGATSASDLLHTIFEHRGVPVAGFGERARAMDEWLVGRSRCAA